MITELIITYVIIFEYKYWPAFLSLNINKNKNITNIDLWKVDDTGKTETSSGHDVTSPPHLNVMGESSLLSSLALLKKESQSLETPVQCP